VRHFRAASSYIAAHRGKTFVILLPGEVLARPDLLKAASADLCLLHGLGVRLVVVLGTKPQIDARLRSSSPAYQAGDGPGGRLVGGYRVTDAPALAAAIDAAGAARVAVEASLSAALAVPAARRHGRTSPDAEFHYDPPARVVSGNFVTAVRRGVVGGVDFGATGAVRGVQAAALGAQLDGGAVVLLSNLGFTVAGQPLNLACHDVAAHAAACLGADKLVCLTGAEVAGLGLPQWLPLRDAVALVEAGLGPGWRGGSLAVREGGGGGSAPAAAAPPPSIRPSLPPLDADSWAASRFPSALLACVAAVQAGVARAHLVDARQDGGLLLELYSRDGVGTMISADFYEGIRAAADLDAPCIVRLLAPLAEAGITRARSAAEVEGALPDFTVVERDGALIGCAQLAPLGPSPDGASCAELAAFCIAPAYRGSGRGDALLDYVEQAARDRGFDRVLLLTTRTADWFVQRSFAPAGPAAASALLPGARRAGVDPNRGAKLFVKAIVKDLGPAAAPPGKRIGF
jgi:amino-acid N-acetyltransferase